MSLPGLPELLVIFGVLFLLFGAKRLPQLGSAIGEGIRNFKDGLSGKNARLENQEEKKTSAEKN